MIDKISRPPITSKISQVKKEKVDTLSKVEKHPSKSDQKSLIGNVLSQLTINNSDQLEKIRIDVITQTLTQALGEVSSNEVVFKRLIQKIDNALKDDPRSNIALSELIKKLDK